MNEMENSEKATRWQIPSVSGVAVTQSMVPPSAKQLEQLQKKAYEEGFQSGYQDGKSEAEAEVLQLKDRICQTVTSVNQSLSIIDHEVENQLIRLIVKLIAQLLRKEYLTDPGLLQLVVHEVISELLMPGLKIQVYLNPEDALFFRETLASAELKNIEIVDQPKLQRGDCKFVTQTTDIDGTIETRIKNIMDHHFASKT